MIYQLSNYEMASGCLSPCHPRETQMKLMAPGVFSMAWASGHWAHLSNQITDGKYSHPFTHSLILSLPPHLSVILPFKLKRNGDVPSTSSLPRHPRWAGLAKPGQNQKTGAQSRFLTQPAGAQPPGPFPSACECAHQQKTVCKLIQSLDPGSPTWDMRIPKGILFTALNAPSNQKL